MELDAFVDTGHGLTVLGASPDYLDELLARYSVLQRTAGYDPEEFLLPGLSRAQIIDAWAERGVQAPEEAVRLWQWHNGYPPGRYPGTSQDSLEKALGRYDAEEKGRGDFLWSPDWITVAMNGGYAMNTVSDPPLVWGSDAVIDPDTWDPNRQVISFCTVVAIGIYAREQGFYHLNEIGLPSALNASWPAELAVTGLLLW
jgi:hypothetical protein